MGLARYDAQLGLSYPHHRPLAAPVSLTASQDQAPSAGFSGPGGQYSHRFDVRGLREHVGHAGRQQLEAMLVHQLPEVARQAAGMAGHIDQPAWRQPRQRRQQLTGADARRVEQHMAVGTACPGQRIDIGTGEVRAVKHGIGNAIGRGIPGRPCHQARIAFHANHARAAARQGQREIAQSAEQVEVSVADECTVLVLRVLDAPSAADQQLLLEFEARHGLRLYLQPGGLATVRPLREPEATLDYALPDFNLRLKFLPSDFIQVNAELNRSLVTRVVQLLELDERSRVLDLFCGLGNFTLALARRCASARRARVAAPRASPASG